VAFVPYLGREDTPRAPWMDSFLRHLAEYGGIEMAAQAAGVHRNTVARHRDRDPLFAEEVEAARAFFADGLEWEHVELGRLTGNPAFSISKLKAERPARWIERQAVAVYNLEAAAVGCDMTLEELRELLRASIEAAMPETRRELGLPPLPIDGEAKRALPPDTEPPPA
jgi:hypothetical protein